MTPEALHDYLVTRGFSEDVAQDVLVSYLARTKPVPVRHLKTWAWKAAVRRKGHYHGGSPTESKVDMACDPLPEPLLAPATAPDPLHHAMTRQELAHAFQHPPKLKRGGQRQGGLKTWREDYDALLREP